MIQQLQGNLNLRDAIPLAESLGCHIEHLRRTGEIYITHPSWQKPLVVNVRRKDTNRVFMVKLRQLANKVRVASP